MNVRDPVWDVARLIITVLTIGVAVWALLEGLQFRPLAAYFPVSAAAMIIVFGSIQLAFDVRNFLAKRAVVIPGMDVESPIHGKGMRGLIPAVRYMGWFVGFVLLYYVTGILVAGVAFVGAFLRVEAKWRWGGTILAAVAVGLASFAMIQGLGLAVPDTLLDIGHDLL